MNSFSKKVQMAIDSEFPGTKPAPSLWLRVASTLPAPAVGRRLTVARYLPGAIAGILVLSLSGVALASTPQGRAAIDWAFGHFGIHLVVNTPELQANLAAQGAEVTQGVDVPWQGRDQLQSKLPTGMHLPTYLPTGFDHPYVSLNTWSSGAGVSFATKSDQHLFVEYHSSVFSRGSMTATNGEARDAQEVKINGKTGLAYRDNSGWTVTWALYGHQYTVQTNISLAETVKVAESIQ